MLGLYFHFQLLTNLASVAERHGCGERRRILVLRTVRTVLMTLLVLPLPWNENLALTWTVAIVHVIAALWIASTLFAFRRSMRELPDAGDDAGGM